MVHVTWKGRKVHKRNRNCLPKLSFGLHTAELDVCTRLTGVEPPLMGDICSTYSERLSYIHALERFLTFVMFNTEQASLALSIDAITSTSSVRCPGCPLPVDATRCTVLMHPLPSHSAASASADYILYASSRLTSTADRMKCSRGDTTSARCTRLTLRRDKCVTSTPLTRVLRHAAFGDWYVAAAVVVVIGCPDAGTGRR
jgi:hypothetical protein